MDRNTKIEVGGTKGHIVSRLGGTTLMVKGLALLLLTYDALTLHFGLGVGV